MTLEPSTVAILSMLVAFLAVLPVWCYYRGTSRQSPIPATPKIVDRLLNPPAKAPVAPKPAAPVFPCPNCTGERQRHAAWELTESRAHWRCTECGHLIAGPNAPART